MVNVKFDNFIAGGGSFHNPLLKGKAVREKSATIQTIKNNVTASSASLKPSGFFSTKNQVAFGNNAKKSVGVLSRYLSKVKVGIAKTRDKALQSERCNKFFEYGESAAGVMEAISAFAIATTIRPLAIAAVPGAEKRDKQYAMARSWATAILDISMAYLLLDPISKAYKSFEDKINTAIEKNDFSKFGKLEKSVKKAYEKGKYNHIKKAMGAEANRYVINFGGKFIVTPLRALLTVAVVIPLIIKHAFPHKEDSKEVEKLKSPIRFQSNRANMQKIFQKFQMKGVQNANK